MLKSFNQASNILLSSSSIGYNDKDNTLASFDANLSNIFRNKPFYFEIEENNHNGINCCFNHMIGLPLKNDNEYPLFDYEKLIFDAIEENKHVWIKKSRGIGGTELVLRYLA